MLKPVDIHNKEFKKAVRGYDPVEVDAFLDQIIVDYEQMEKELDALHNQISAYSSSMTSYRERESALNNALISAQQFADNIKKDAEFQAKKMIEDAEKKSESIIGSSEKKVKIAQQRYAQIIEHYNETKDNICSYLKAQFDMVQQGSIEVADELLKEEPEVIEDSEETKINKKIKELMNMTVIK